MIEENQPVNQTASGPPKKKPWLIVVPILVLIGIFVGGYLVFADKPRGGNENGQDFASDSTTPACPSPLILEPPTDLSKVVSVLYPGQVRGGDYKPHGGLRLADGNNDIVVTASLDASVVDGSRYIESGEIQYLFDFMNDCGIKYRLDHLHTLSASFATLADNFPAAKENDSRTTNINPPIKVKTGDTIATAVGFITTGNAGFDFGVYDLRQENEASKSAAFQAAHADDIEQAAHAICWFDVLSPENSAKIRSLPSTSPSSESDYCNEF